MSCPDCENGMTTLLEWIASRPRAFKRWNTWRKYNKLSPIHQKVMQFGGVDPETLIKRGLL